MTSCDLLFRLFFMFIEVVLRILNIPAYLDIFEPSHIINCKEDHQAFAFASPSAIFCSVIFAFQKLNILTIKTALRQQMLALIAKGGYVVCSANHSIDNNRRDTLHP